MTHPHLAPILGVLGAALHTAARHWSNHMAGVNIGNVFGSILGGVLKGRDPQDVLKSVATQATAGVAGPVIDEYLQTHLSAAGRVEVADNLIAAGTAIKTGNIQAGSNAIAALIGGIKF